MQYEGPTYQPTSNICLPLEVRLIGAYLTKKILVITSEPCRGTRSDCCRIAAQMSEITHSVTSPKIPSADSKRRPPPPPQQVRAISPHIGNRAVPLLVCHSPYSGRDETWLAFSLNFGSNNLWTRHPHACHAISTGYQHLGPLNIQHATIIA